MALNDKITLPSENLQRFGRLLVRYIREEAKKDAALSPQIPDSKEFYESFSYRVRGNEVEISSSWEWIDLLVNGSDGPFPMKWLTAARGVKRIPLKDDQGRLIFRTTPLTTDKAWIHPGVAKHTFIQRAFDRAHDEMARMMLDVVMAKAFRRG